jgi:tripartite-type tricarboxylate transporter receptor subunit TctC
MTTWFRATLLALLAAVSAGGAHAQGYPAKPVRLIIAFPAGGGSDVMGRIVAQKLSERFGHQVIVDNRPGAGGSIGTEAAVRSAPDGYTLQLASTSEVSINRSLYTKLSYDPLKDLAPITGVASTPMVLIVHPSMPVKTIKDLVALAKARPGQINYSSAGSGTTTHLSAELFRAMTHINIVHVPYKGAPPALADLVGGHVQMMFSTLPAVLPLITGNRLRPVAVSSTTRSRALPDVPTMVEAGVAGYEVNYWYGMFVPLATPKEIIGVLYNHLTQALRSPEMIANINKQGAEPVSMTTGEFAQFLKADAERWAKAVKFSGAKAD